jgi:hypothetical protein
MRLLGLAGSGERLLLLCLGAHADDIEIGAGATILGWIERGLRLATCRREEAHASAKEFLADTARARINFAAFRDGVSQSSCTTISARNAQRTGSMHRPSWVWRACAARNVARRRDSRKPSTDESWRCNDQGERRCAYW